MKEMIGKSCKICVEFYDKLLIYHANEVTDVTDSHISFLDKNNETFIFRVKDIKEISDVKVKSQ